MIKIMVKTALILTFSLIVQLKVESKKIEKKLMEFNEKIIENSIKYVLCEDAFLVFDYDDINEKVEEIFKEYNTKITYKSESSFDVEIELNFGFINEKIKENYMLKKGEKYEKFD